MPLTLIGTAVSLIVTILFLFVLRPVAIEIELVDVPGGRKRHLDPVPIIGGLAMALGLGVGSIIIDTPAFWAQVLVAFYMLIIVGTIDDRYDLPASVRLFSHSCTAFVVVFGAELVVTHLGAPLFFDLPLGPVSALFSMLFIVTVISAFNVIDGLDGLAGGVAFITLSAGAVISAGSPVFVLLALLLAVILGFLIFNLPLPFNRPMRVFMGDAGSTSLGLVIAALGFGLTQGDAALMTPVIALWLIALPVFDLFSAIVRRLKARRSVFAPDNLHLHHVLIQHGHSRRTTLCIMLAVAALFAGIGLLGHVASVSDGWMLIGWFISGVLYYQFTAGNALWLLGAKQPVVGSSERTQESSSPIRVTDQTDL